MKTLTEFNEFKNLCLENAESAFSAVQLLQGKSMNHIAFNLGTLALEEIGKVTIVWFNFLSREEAEFKRTVIPIDDLESGKQVSATLLTKLRWPQTDTLDHATATIS